MKVVDLQNLKPDLNSIGVHKGDTDNIPDRWRWTFYNGMQGQDKGKWLQTEKDQVQIKEEILYCEGESD